LGGRCRHAPAVTTEVVVLHTRSSTPTANRPGYRNGTTAAGATTLAKDDGDTADSGKELREQRRDLGRYGVVDSVMKKISALAALTVTGLALATPAHADNAGDHGHINVTGRNLSAAGLCKQALGLVPLAAPWTDEAVDDACNNRDHVHHAHNQ